MSKKSLREDMPVVSYFIDEMRKLLGRDYVDDQIRRSMQGEPTFHASENGHSIGTSTNKGVQSVIAWDEQGIAFSVTVTPGVSMWEEIERIKLVRRNEQRKLGRPISRHDDNEAD